MITTQRAEKLYEKMCGEIACEFNSVELDALVAVMTSSVAIKAFGRSLAYCQMIKHQMSEIDMSKDGGVLDFTRAQGRVQGVNEMIHGILQLITEKDEEPEDD